MAGEKIKGLAIELDMDHLSVDRGLKGLKDNIRTVNSEMKRNMSAFDRSERSVKKYETSLYGLNKKLEVQKVAVAEAKKEYEAMVNEYGRGSKEAEAAAREYNNQAASLNNLERYIERTKNELVEFEKQQRIANSGWTKMGDKLEFYGGKLKGFGSKMSDVGSQMTNKITKPTLIATTAAAGLVGALGWKRLTGLDAAQAQLKGLGYSTKEVGRISDQVTTAIDGGMTTMAEGTAVAAGALAAGVKEGKELERYIKLVGDAAVGANRPVEEMAMIFNRVQGNGKLMTQELNSIEQGMPGFSKAMSKHLGVSSEEFRKMVTEGKVSSKDFLDVMEDFAGGMASAYSESWDGMVANTKAYIGIIGENFLRGIFQDSKKSLADFIEMLKSPEIQQRAAEMGETARVAFNKMKDSIMGAVEWYQNLDDGQKTMIKRLGLMAVAGGPVLQFAGKLTSGLGSVLEVTGKLSKSIGVARGAGLAAGLASLGPGAVAGVAVVGIAAVATGLYTLHKRSKEAEEVNLDVAESLSDQAIELEKSADTFDKLSEKAKISNEQLAELNDLNIRISESSNPGEINELQKQYDALAEKSGLSKKELKKLFGANENIIEQSPNVQKSVSDTGNAFADNTDAVREYVDSLYEMSRVELEGQRNAALERKIELNKEINKGQKELNGLLDEMGIKNKASELSEVERKKRITEIKEKLDDRNISFEKGNALQEELTALMDIEDGRLGDSVKHLQEKIDKKRESNEKSQEELDKINALEENMGNIILKQSGINEEGEKGLAQLDKSLVKNTEEIEKLEAKRKKNGELTEEEQKRYDKLTKTNEKQLEAKEYLNDELGIYKDINSLANLKIDSLNKEGQKKVENLAKTIDIKAEEGNIIKQIDKKNSKHVEEIGNLEEKRKKNGANKKEIDGQIASIDSKIIKNAEVKKQILQETGIWKDLDSKIKDGINSEIEKGHKVNDTKGKLDSQGKSIDNNNSKTSKGINLEESRTKEAGKDVTKNVAVKDNGTIDTLNLRATAPKSKSVAIKDNGTINTLNMGVTAPKTKSVTLSAGSSLTTLNREASSPVRKVVNLVGVGGSNLTKNIISRVRGYAKGTPKGGHSGGDAVLGDGKGSNAGSELAVLPSGRAFLSADKPTFYPSLPKGAHVFPAKQTKSMLEGIKHYASGTDYQNSDFMKLLALNSKDSETKIRMPHQLSNVSGGVNDDIESKITDKLDQLIELMKNMPRGDINFYDKKDSPSESARKVRKAQQQWALGLR